MAAVDPREPALSLRFSVSIGSFKIERFATCDGLTAEYEVEEYREGGQGGFVHKLPVRLKHTNVRMTRPVDKDSGVIAGWFTMTRTKPSRQDATITAYDGNGAEVASWHLVGAWPVKYTGPQLSSVATTAATETLEIAHNGFDMRPSS
jgi:phage tail-like protein